MPTGNSDWEQLKGDVRLAEELHRRGDHLGAFKELTDIMATAHTLAQSIRDQMVARMGEVGMTVPGDVPPVPLMKVLQA